jgi:type IV pilus assembly protein PilM
MFPSLLSGQTKKRGQVVAVDLGQRTTKAVQVARKGGNFQLQQYAVLDAPVSDKSPSPELLGEHLRGVMDALGYRGKVVALVLGVNESFVRQTEVPMIPVNDLRLMLKFTSKAYLQQDLPDHVFDCHILGPVEAKTAEGGAKTQQKARVLVGGARKQLMEELQQGVKNAGLQVEQVVPGLICPANAFEMSYPEMFAKEVVALVDIGFRSSSISILLNGEMKLNRVVSIGGDKLTAGLAESMGVSYAEAEGIKMELPEEVHGIMQALIMQLGRELRASIDFFEHQQDRPVAQVFVSGGSARSQFLIESLQGELMVQTKGWNPAGFLDLAIPPEKMGQLEQVASQLTVAIGGAMAVL